MTALVIEADDPLDNRFALGRSALGAVRILVDAKPDPLYVTCELKLDRDHWPVRGMELPILIDPAEPEKCEIRWNEVPSMKARAAANDPTLADPAGTTRKTEHALLASGAVGPAGPARPEEGVRAFVVEAQADAAGGDDGRPDHWQESLERAAREPAPAGKRRAVVLFSASEATLRTEGGNPDGTGGTLVRERHGTHDVVLAVTVPGSEPYAVYIPKFKHKGGRGVALGAGIPALVSESDPWAVEILWDELPSQREQLQETVAEARELAQASLATGAERMEEATRLLNARTAEAGPPPETPTGAPGITREMKEMMRSSAKMAISAAPTPEVRRLIIDQYRLAGIAIDEHGNLLD